MTAEPDKAPKKSKIIQAECSECGGIRNCKIRGHFARHQGDDDYSWHVGWYILQCRGCETVFVRTVSSNSEDYENYYERDGSTGVSYNETIAYWPARNKRRFPEWMSEAGIDADQVGRLDEALVELYKALNSDLYILAGIGIRTSFDVAASLLGIEETLNFKEKLDALQDMGKISSQDKIRLNTLVEAGNASAHRGWKPTAKDLSTMMDALEYFVHETFVIPARKARVDTKLAEMDEGVPRRKAKKSN